MNSKSTKSARGSGQKSHECRVERLSAIADENVRKLSSLVLMHDEGFAVTTDDYSDLPLIREKLNPEEKKLFDEDPLVGARVLLQALTATNTVKDLYVQAHKVAGVREAIEAAGVRLLYLPPYSPDFNPIEQIFAKLKQLLRTAAARTVPDLWAAIRVAFTRFTPDECRNCIEAAGYEDDLAVAT